MNPGELTLSSELTRARRRLNPSFRKGTDPSVLRTIHEPDVNCAVWLRPPMEAGATAAITSWAHEKGCSFNRVLDVDAGIDDAMEGLLDESARRLLAADLRDLVTRFVELGGGPRIKAFFGIISGDQCRKFHFDYLALRLITTYVGPGTEWLPEEGVRREVLEDPPECPHEANDQIVRDPALVQRARAGDVLVLKGARYPTDRPIVHRSPPIEGSGVSRLVLILSTYEPAP